MLVFTRNIGESFRIGNDVEIMVTAVSGVSVRLGVEAPRHVQVHRSEVHERIAASTFSTEKSVKCQN